MNHLRIPLELEHKLGESCGNPEGIHYSVTPALERERKKETGDRQTQKTPPVCLKSQEEDKAKGGGNSRQKKSYNSSSLPHLNPLATCSRAHKKGSSNKKSDYYLLLLLVIHTGLGRNAPHFCLEL